MFHNISFRVEILPSPENWGVGEYLTEPYGRFPSTGDEDGNGEQLMSESFIQEAINKGIYLRNYILTKMSVEKKKFREVILELSEYIQNNYESITDNELITDNETIVNHDTISDILDEYFLGDFTDNVDSLRERYIEPLRCLGLKISFDDTFFLDYLCQTVVDDILLESCIEATSNPEKLLLDKTDIMSPSWLP